jgi:AbrB family looped-hinge helix DNA binding protein
MTNTIIIGKSGRLVIPKRLRERLGLHTGARLRVQIAAGMLQLEPVPDEVNIAEEDGFPVISGGPTRKRGQTVEAINADREARDKRVVRKEKAV